MTKRSRERRGDEEKRKRPARSAEAEKRTGEGEAAGRGVEERNPGRTSPSSQKGKCEPPTLRTGEGER